MKKVLIIGDDARFPYMEGKFRKMNWKSYHIQIADSHQLTSMPIETFHIILLPIQGVTSPLFSNDIWMRVQKDTLIFSGRYTPFMDQIQKLYGLHFINLFAADDIAIYNAVPTAEGVLQIAMEHTVETISGMSVMLFGFGRVGQTIGQLFQRVGAYVTVLTNDPAEQARAVTNHMHAQALSDPLDYEKYPLMINTIPAPIITDETASQMQERACIIDIASGSGGLQLKNDHPLRKNLIHALGLPSKVAVSTASDIIVQAIVQKYEERAGN